jgi:outer membrane receptor for ferrienterochelin and colicin
MTGTKRNQDVIIKGHNIKPCLLKSRKVVFLLFAFLLSFISVALVEAAEDTPSSLFKMPLEEVMNLEVKVEVASLFMEDELLVASTVSNISSNDWEKSGARRTYEAFMNEMSVMTYNTVSSHAIAIRGYTSNFSAVRGLATSLDGVPLNTMSYGTALYGIPNFELGTLDRIEMIKGPASAIYGSDAFHGVISMQSIESDSNTYSVKVRGGGEPSYREGNIRISHGIGEKIRINTAISASHQGDQNLAYEHTGNGPGVYRNLYDSVSGVLKVTLNPSDRLKIDWGAYFADFEGHDFFGLVSLAWNRDQLDYGTNTISGDTDFYMGRGSISYQFENDINIEARGYIWESDALAIVPSFDYGGGTYMPGIETGYWGQVDRRYGGDLIIKQSHNPFNIQWVLGYFYTFMETPDATIYNKNNSTGEITELVFSAGQTPGKRLFEGVDRSINSIIAQTKWRFIKDRLYLLLGARYDDYSDFGSQFTPRAGVIFLPAEDSAIKLLYGNAFRAPVGAELKGVNFTRGNPDIKPETIDVYELAYLSRGDHWKLSTTGFYSKWKDGITWKPVTGDPDGFTSAYDNMSESRSYGCEVNGSYSFTSIGIITDFGFSYVKSETLHKENAGDHEFGAFPKFMARAGVNYQAPFGINIYINNRIYWDMTESVEDAFFENLAMTTMKKPDKLPTYWRVDLNFNKILSSRIKIGMDIRNLLDRRNYTPSLWGNPGGDEEPGISVLLKVIYSI